MELRNLQHLPLEDFIRHVDNEYQFEPDALRAHELSEFKSALETMDDNEFRRAVGYGAIDDALDNIPDSNDDFEDR